MFDVQAHVDAEAADAPPPASRRARPTRSSSTPPRGSRRPRRPRRRSPSPSRRPRSAEQPPLDIRGPDAEVAGHPPAEAEEDSAEFDFFNEQRLSDELDQALEAPPPTDEHLAMPQYEDAPPARRAGSSTSRPRSTYEEDPSEEVLRRADERAAAEEPPSEEYRVGRRAAVRGRPLDATVDQPRPNFDPPSEEARRRPPPADAEEDGDEFDPETGHEDVLEDTPRFLEDAPEDDDLWFEQKPPKDFDLD